MKFLILFIPVNLTANSVNNRRKTINKILILLNISFLIL